MIIGEGASETNYYKKGDCGNDLNNLVTFDFTPFFLLKSNVARGRVVEPVRNKA